MLTVNDIPAYWRLVLQRVQEFDPHAQISGGALRDLWCGVAPKDLDVAVSFETDMSALKTAMGATIKTYEEKGESYIKSQNRFVETFVAEGLEKNIPINAVRLAKDRSPEDEYHHHDFGACQITFDGKELHHTAAFLEDIEHKKFTLLRADSHSQFRRSIMRYFRWIARYPDWMLVLPQGLAATGLNDSAYITLPKQDVVEIMAAFNALIEGFEDQQPKELVVAAKTVNAVLKKAN